MEQTRKRRSARQNKTDDQPMTWAVEHRMDFVDWRLLMRGEVQRDDIRRVFGVSMSQASADLKAFLKLHPGAMVYDTVRKRYVPAKAPYKSRRGMDAMKVREALNTLAKLGWWEYTKEK